MAAITSNAVTGDWNNSASWVGGVIPGAGDTVTIANLAVITIPTGISVVAGDSANPGTHAIRTAGTGGTGRLIVDAGATLTLNGNVLQGNATWHIGSASGGATVIFDHATTKLTWQIADAASQANALLWIRGASGNRSVVRKSAAGVVGGGFGNVSVANVGGGRMEVSYAAFDGIGDATASDAAAFLKCRPTTAAHRIIFSHVSLTSCGKILLTTGLPVDGIFTLDFVRITAPVAVSNRSIQIQGTCPALTTGARRIADCYIEGQVYIVPAAGGFADFTIERTILSGLPAIEPFTGESRVFMTDVLHYNRESVNASSGIPGGTLTRLMALRDGGSGADHIRLVASIDLTIDGFYGEFLAGGDDYLVIPGAPAALSTITLKNAVCPPGATGTLLIPSYSGTDYNTLRVVIEHCTYPLIQSTNTSGLFCGEANTGSAGVVLAVRSNIGWRQTPGIAHLTNTTATAAGMFVGDGISHNATWNITPNTPADLYKPSATQYSGTPGANALNDVNPQFANPARNFLAWGQSLNPALTTWAQILAEMAKLSDDTGYDSRFSISAAYTWVRGGWVPRNTALSGAAHDGGDIGALAVAASASISSIVPATGAQGTAPSVTITGSNTTFSGATTVTVSGTGVSVSGIAAANATSLSCTLTIAAGATTGARTVTVTTGAEVVTTTFTVTAATPTASISIAPPNGAQGTAPAVSITGTNTNFSAGTTSVSVSGSGVIVSGLLVSSATALICTLTIAPTAAPTLRTVTVTTGAEVATTTFLVIAAEVEVPPAPEGGAQYASTAHNYDELLEHGPITVWAVIAAGQGLLLRGTVLGLTDGKWDTTSTPSGILTHDVDTSTGDAQGVVHTQGRFKSNVVIPPVSLTLAQTADALRDIGIYLMDVQE